MDNIPSPPLFLSLLLLSLCHRRESFSKNQASSKLSVDFERNLIVINLLFGMDHSDGKYILTQNPCQQEEKGKLSLQIPSFSFFPWL